MKAFLLNSAGGTEVRFERVSVPATAFGRMRGLLGRPAPAAGEALWLRPCRSIHTIGMRYAIDVLFLDRHGTVLRARRDLPPGRLAFAPRGAASVLECGGGSIPPDTAPGWRVEGIEGPPVRREAMAVGRVGEPPDHRSHPTEPNVETQPKNRLHGRNVECRDVTPG
jgi:uncharacterized protein